MGNGSVGLCEMGQGWVMFVSGKESRGARGVRVDFWWRRLRASLRMTVWAPLLPLRIEVTDTTLEQVRGWRVPGPAEG